MFAILGDAANAYNAIPWQDAFPFRIMGVIPHLQMLVLLVLVLMVMV